MPKSTPRNRDSRHLRPAVVSLGAALSCLLGPAGCDRQGADAGGVALIPQPPQGEIELSPQKPDMPFAQLAPGILSRTRHAAEAPPRFRVEVRDFLVGPGQSTAEVRLPAAAVLEVRAGTGTISIEGEQADLKPGVTFSVAEGQRFQIANGSDAQIAIRALLISAM